MRAGLTAICLVGLTVLSACLQLSPEQKSGYAAVEVDEQPAQNLDQACIANYRADIDYFPNKTAFRHSNQLSVEYHRHFKRITFRPSVSSEASVELLLVQCGTPVPDHGPDTIVVSVPVSRIVTASRSMLGAADDLGVVERFVGISDPRAITVPSFRERVDRGLIAMMSGHAHGNIEPLLAMDPDVYFTFHSAYPQFNIHPKLWALGIRAVPHGDSLEATPLGRAEWLKLLAMLTNREARANPVFDRLEAAYGAIVRLVEQTNARPKVMAGVALQRDVIELFGGRNHRARLLHDAGGRFVLENDRFPGSWLMTSFERVYAVGADAETWIGTRPGITSIEALIAANAHHRWFETAVRSGEIYALDRGYQGLFAHHLEDQGLNNPHRQLAEIAAVLHPELHEQLKTFRASPLFIRRLP